MRLPKTQKTRRGSITVLVALILTVLVSIVAIA